MTTPIRDRELDKVKNSSSYDALIIGGGINGASIFKTLSEAGYKTLLLDSHDFSSGTSQASGMMIWGGLLYLAKLDFFNVYKLSRDRNRILSKFNKTVHYKPVRYVMAKTHGHSKPAVLMVTYLYWLMGLVKTKRPFFQHDFPEQDFLNNDNIKTSAMIEEGFIAHSDARFVLNWILSSISGESSALNYSSIESAEFNKSDNRWTVSVKDSINDSEFIVKPKLIINAAGVWTDEINSRFGINSPYKHAFSKGVFLNFKRPEKLAFPHVFDLGENKDTLSLIPWGPLAMWGPTEQKVNSIEEGFSVTESDIEFLKRHGKKHLDDSIVDSPLVSLRCGIRPLAVDKSFSSDIYPLELSRHFKIHYDDKSNWLSVYGGKFSGCLSMSEKVLSSITKALGAPYKNKDSSEIYRYEDAEKTEFPHMPKKVVTIKHSVENEFCCTIQDYLRRRTNISQWIPREGLGDNNQNYDTLKNAIEEAGLSHSYIKSLNKHVKEVENNFDPLLK